MSNVSNLFGASMQVPPRQAYARKVEAMDDDQFFSECKRVTLLAAFASEDAESDFHWQHLVCAAQARLRGRPELYEKALTDQSAPAGKANAG